MISSGKFGNTGNGSTGFASKHAATPQTKFNIVRYVFNSADTATRESLSKNVIFQLPSPINNVCYVDWALVKDVLPCMLQIRELPNNGVTTKGVPYFATIIGGTSQNILTQHQHRDSYDQPRDIDQLTFNFHKFRSSDTDQSTEWTIELYFYQAE